MPQNIPVIANVDVLIIGASSGAVAAALAAQASGASVYLISPVPYLGDDIGADLQLWCDEPQVLITDLARQVFTSSPIRPMHAKVTLEQSLVKAEIPFLLNTHPAGLLTDAQGRLTGCVLANRAGRQVIQAKALVGATALAVVARQAGFTWRDGPTGFQDVEHRVLLEPVIDLRAEQEVLQPPLSGEIKEKPYSLHGAREILRVDCGTGSCADLAQAQATVREQTWQGGTFLQSERLRFVHPPRLAASPVAAATIESVRPEDYFVQDNLAVLSACLPANEVCRRELQKPWRLMAAGAQLGQELAARTQQPGAAVTGAAVNSAAPKLVLAGARAVAGALRTRCDGLRPGEVPSRVVSIDDKVPVLGTFDVVVVGGGTGGAPAAISAGRHGARTAVIEAQAMLGGVGTAGQISKYWFGNRVGFTAEVDAAVAQRETDARFQKGKGAWTVHAKASWLHHACYENNVALLTRCTVVGVQMDGERVIGVLVASPDGYGLIQARAFIDSSGCAEIAAAAGAPTVAIGAQHVAVQGTGLGAFRHGYYDNSDHNFSDDTDIIDATTFLVSSKLKYPEHIDAGQLIDSRERRQIIGDATLDPADFMFERRFPDTICVASSNFDTHGFTVHPLFLIKPPPHREQLWVDVPYRCLLPQGLTGVIVTGLGVSAHRDALPVIRMQPDVQNQGYAAGYAAVLALQQAGDFRAINVRSLQQHLVTVGNLPARVVTDQDNFPMSDEMIEQAVREGWDDFAGLALIFAEQQRAVPMLRDALQAADQSTDLASQQVRYALLLALCGDATGAEVLGRAVEAARWDAGWEYTGMGQFGMSTSVLDGVLIALGHVGDAQAWPVIFEKIEALSPQPEFSHCRALGEACEALYRRVPHAGAAAQLMKLVRAPGISGHHHATILAAQGALDEDACATTPRNNALRELHLARAAFRCGDIEGQAAQILRAYADDVRGHFARHARAVLAEAHHLAVMTES
jgi:ribulose 1,5-bisphosphate synthetase/thiazole synthase